MRFNKLKDTGIKEKKSNGARSQEIIWKIKETGEKFRVLIHSESYVFQSYFRLYKWSDANNEWNLVTVGNPANDYNIDISYKTSYSSSAFDPIINDLKKLAKQFSNG
jgi:hypothetical protein